MSFTYDVDKFDVVHEVSFGCRTGNRRPATEYEEQLIKEIAELNARITALEAVIAEVEVMRIKEFLDDREREIRCLGSIKTEMTMRLEHHLKHIESLKKERVCGNCVTWIEPAARNVHMTLDVLGCPCYEAKLRHSPACENWEFCGGRE